MPAWLRSRYTIFAASCSVFLLLDVVTKVLVRRLLRTGSEEFELIPGFLSFIHAENPTAAFGFLGFLPVGFRVPLLVTFAAIAVIVLGSMVKQLDHDDRFSAFILGLIASGAIGNNLIDRPLRGTVTDFIKVYTEWDPLASKLQAWFHTSEWPTFNIADSAIVVGVLLFLIKLGFQKDTKTEDVLEA